AVVLDVGPGDARVAAGDAFRRQLPGRLLVGPGERRLHVSREGYASRETSFLVPADARATLHVALDKLPGVLHIDTGGVVARVSVDGVAAGLAPGEVPVPAGTRTLTLSPPRYLDYTP